MFDVRVSFAADHLDAFFKLIDMQSRSLNNVYSSPFELH